MFDAIPDGKPLRTFPGIALARLVFHETIRDEHGSAADLSVDDRDVNVFDFRAQLAYALAARPLDGGVLHTALRFGADATFADNDNVDVVLLGEVLNFSVGGDAFTLDVPGGLKIQL